jgi:Cu-Zn family superoxide dismutase
MGRGSLMAVGAAAAFGLATAILAAQAPTAPPPQNPPPASVDPSLAQGQGRGGSPIQMGRAAIKGANGISGNATLYEIANGQGHMVQIILTLQNAPPGLHGVHIHTVGRCEGPDFKSAGGHFDPGPAGNVDPEVNHPYHMGDLPNINVNAQGSAQYNIYSTRITMGGPTGLFDSDGAAIVIHQNLDTVTPGPSGSGVAGGAAIACGAIER